MSRRVLLSILAAVLVVLGGITAIGGAAVLLIFANDGRLSTGVERITTSTRALVTKTGDVTGISSAPSWTGGPTVNVVVTGSSSGAPFVGIGPAAAVDAYLAGVEHDVVTDFEVAPFVMKTQRQAGTRAPAAPADQPFWVAKGVQNGGTTSLSWAVLDGEYRVVVMNASAAPGVQADGRLGVAISGMKTVGILVLCLGLVIAAVGIVPLVMALAGRDRPTASPLAPQPPSAPPTSTVGNAGSAPSSVDPVRR